jgi:Putative prokaryotic signal transducing protein
MPDATRLTVVSSEQEAEIVCSILRSEGIRCFHRVTDLSAPMRSGSLIEWREILVLSDDLEGARELIQPVEQTIDNCVRCGRPIDEQGGWFESETGELAPYCGVCAERVFGPA